MEKPKWSYWSLAVMGLLWGVMGCLNFVMQMNDDFISQLPPRYYDIIAVRPFWATAAFAFAVFGGTVGCILLLLRKKVAVQLLGLSLVGCVVTFGYMVLSLGPSLILSTGVSVLVAAVLLWLAVMARSRNWLR